MPVKFILGRHVVNEWGVELGTIEDLALDPEHGSIAYAVMCYRGAAAGDEKCFAVPWDSLTFHPESHEFLLDISRDQLEEVPGFSRGNWPEAADYTSWTAQVFSSTPEQS
jgi:hypothetical protein